MWFGTTIRHDAHDGSDITEASMIEAVTSRIKDIFEHRGEFENAVELQDTCATGDKPIKYFFRDGSWLLAQEEEQT